DKSAMSLGFQVQSAEAEHEHRYKEIRSKVMDSMKKTFRPEFLNRIDEIIVFQQLTKEEIRRIVDIMAAELQGRIKAQGMELVITDDCKDVIAKEGYNPTYGARPLRRAIQRLLEDALAEQVLMGKFKEGDTIKTELDGETINFEKSSGKKSDNGNSPDDDSDDDDKDGSRSKSKSSKKEKAEKDDKEDSKKEEKSKVSKSEKSSKDDKKQEAGK
ncbi:MAG: AAA family ATPase, partial [Cyanobacteria bacterium HKST-UBA01]|nr:AAA family ATPase [Cyanobacteria bacterium HKST-UBA01]